MEEKSMIDIQHLRKSYGSFIAVEDVSFSVEKGEIFGLLGPNGAGKTSILETLEGLREPNGGTIRVGSLDPVREQHKLRNVIGVQLQSAGMPESITPVEAMKFFCAYHRVDPRYDLLKRVGLQEKSNTQFYELSTGQQRRLSLALAVAHRPQILFLDEPTAGLDVASRVDLHAMMRELKMEGTTIILATHDMAEAEELSDRVAILLKGKIAAIGSPMQITSTGAGLTKVSVYTRSGSLTPNQAFPGVQQETTKEEYRVYFTTDIAATVSSILRAIQDNGDQVIDLRVERPSLEDRFLEITQAGKIQ